MRWAVLGNMGMFGSEMESLLRDAGAQVTGYNRTNLDVGLNQSGLAKLLGEVDVIVNAIAYTAVDKAETDETLATKVNAELAGKFACVARDVGARFIHISTDYVFDGTKIDPYEISDATNPQTAYGRSKLLGEQLVGKSGADFSIMRTAWLYGEHGGCFPKSIAKALKANGSARVVDDQVGQPTWTKDLANQVLQVVALHEMPKLIHAVASGSGSWADFACEVAASTGRQGDQVITRITSSEFPTAASRPAWSVLNNITPGLASIGDWKERWLVAADSVLGQA
jgi:dTDP-4-dehydrorhamnose reductase